MDELKKSHDIEVKELGVLECLSNKRTCGWKILELEQLIAHW